MWAALALATLTKGLIAPVFFAAAAIPLLLLSGQWRRWRQFKPFTGILLYLAIAAPWHILAGLANPDQGHPIGNHPTLGNVHGFWYFYFVNEHFFRFLGRALSRTTTTGCPLPPTGCCTWSGSFPGACFCPPLLVVAWKTRRNWTAAPASRCRPDRRFLSGLRRARGRGQLRLPASNSACAPSGC